MKRSTQKLHSRRGETLVEVLAAVLICTLAVLLLTSFVVAAMRADKAAETGDEEFYAALNAAEARDGTNPSLPAVSDSIDVTDGTKTVSVTVQFYGGDGIFSFAE